MPEVKYQENGEESLNKVEEDAKSAGSNQQKNAFASIVSILICLGLAAYFIFPSFTSERYYVAKMSPYSASTFVIDGYMHKDKKCCQNVANAAGAKVIRINPKDKVGENSIGQEISYKDVYRYCPLCSYDF